MNVELAAGMRARDVRMLAGGMVAAAAVWPRLPAHPPLACPLRTTTGIPCPFCGITRAVVAAVHGDLIGSLRYNPLGIALVVLALALLLLPSLRVRAPVWAVAGGGALLWAYNVALNPTFT